jgi:AAA domain
VVVLINGSFGVGKSTVAGLLRRRLSGSIVYDPERVGWVLQRLPRWVPLKGGSTLDFQDIDLWRRSLVMGVRVVRCRCSGPVIVPMTFSHRPYFDEITAGIRRLDSDLRIFCLRAGLATVQERLAGRGDRIEGPGSEWIARRILECAEILEDAHFGEPVDAEGRAPQEIAEDIIRRLTSPLAAVRRSSEMGEANESLGATGG